MNFLNFILFAPEFFFINFLIVFLWIALYLRNKRFSKLNSAVFSFTFYIIYLLGLVSLLFINNSIQEAVIFNQVYVLSSFNLFLKLLTVLSAIIILFVIGFARMSLNLTQSFLDVELLLIKSTIVLSMLLIASLNDLIYLFFAFELYALSAYLLVGYKGKFSVFSSEAALKYFLLSTVFSIVMIYAIALIYMCTGLTNIYNLSTYMTFLLEFSSNQWNFDFITILGVACVLLLISLLFKLAASPFHFWAPDVYDGAPTTTMFFLFIVPKIALLGVFVKLSFLWNFTLCFQVLLISIVLSVVVGSVFGLFQKQIKRLLTYSMINNNGFLLLPLVVLGGVYNYVFLFYFLVVYICSLIGIFTILLSLKSRSSRVLLKSLWSWSNLLFINKPITLSIGLLLFSSAGLPPLVGFLIKFLVLYGVSVGSTNFYILLVFLLCMAPISCFYYIRIMKVMAFSKKRFNVFLVQPSLCSSYIISASVVLLLILFLSSGLILNYISLIFII